MHTLSYRFIALLSSSLGLVACGGGNGPASSHNSVNGTVHGQTYSIQDAVSARLTSAPDSLAVVALTSTNNACADAAAVTLRANQKFAVIEMFEVGTNKTAPTGPGTYTIYAGSGTPPVKAASWKANIEDSMCHDIVADRGSAVSGTITLTEVSGDLFAGHYDVVLDSGDHVTGEFQPEPCPEIQNASTSPTHTCS